MTALHLSTSEHTNMLMGKKTEDRYRTALELLNLKEVSRQTGRGWRTLMGYKRSERRVTEPAARELIDYLRHRSTRLTAAADALEAALEQEEADG